MSTAFMLKQLGVVAKLRDLKRSQADAQFARAQHAVSLTMQQHDAAKTRAEQAAMLWQNAIAGEAGFNPQRAEALGREIIERQHETTSLQEDLDFQKQEVVHAREAACRMQAESESASKNLRSAQKSHRNAVDERGLSRLEDLVTQRSHR